MEYIVINYLFDKGETFSEGILFYPSKQSNWTKSRKLLVRFCYVNDSVLLSFMNPFMVSCCLISPFIG